MQSKKKEGKKKVPRHHRAKLMDQTNQMPPLAISEQANKSDLKSALWDAYMHACSGMLQHPIHSLLMFSLFIITAFRYKRQRHM